MAKIDGERRNRSVASERTVRCTHKHYFEIRIPRRESAVEAERPARADGVAHDAEQARACTPRARAAGRSTRAVRGGPARELRELELALCVLERVRETDLDAPRDGARDHRVLRPVALLARRARAVPHERGPGEGLPGRRTSPLSPSFGVDRPATNSVKDNP